MRILVESASLLTRFESHTVLRTSLLSESIHLLCPRADAGGLRQDAAERRDFPIRRLRGPYATNRTLDHLRSTS